MCNRLRDISIAITDLYKQTYVVHVQIYAVVPSFPGTFFVFLTKFLLICAQIQILRDKISKNIVLSSTLN